MFPFDSPKNIRKPKAKKQSLEALYKEGALKNFAKFTGKSLYQSLFLSKFAAWGLQLS